jgi:hypothetical protein
MKAQRETYAVQPGVPGFLLALQGRLKQQPNGGGAFVRVLFRVD